MNTVVFHVEAEQEFEDSIVYYERQLDGLGREFADAVEKVVERIRSSPQLCSRYGVTEYRTCGMDRFPFTVYFQELDECIWVAAVAHHRRSEGYWLHRSPQD